MEVYIHDVASPLDPHFLPPLALLSPAKTRDSSPAETPESGQGGSHRPFVSKDSTAGEIARESSSNLGQSRCVITEEHEPTGHSSGCAKEPEPTSDFGKSTSNFGRWSQ